MIDQTSNSPSDRSTSAEPSDEILKDANSKKLKKTWDDKVIMWWHENKHILLVFMFILAFLVIYLWNNIFITIMPGEAGVMWRRISFLGYQKGTVLEKTYGEGLHIIFPLNKIYIYETRVQQKETIFNVLSENGLSITVRASVRFRPRPDILPLLHREVGPEYVERIIIPEAQATIRRIIGEYEPEEIYRSQGGILRNVVLTAQAEIGERYVELDDLLIKEIILPPLVRTAIETKLQEEQKFLEYKYRLNREAQEAQRKEIEADGIARFQAKINEGITEDFLRYKGIEATLALAKSNNAKVVVIGSGKDGLPLILNTGDSSPVAESGNSVQDDPKLPLSNTPEE